MVRLADLMDEGAFSEEWERRAVRLARRGDLHVAGRQAGPWTRLGDLVVEIGLTDGRGITRLVEKQSRLRRRLGELLVEEGLLAEGELAKLLNIQVRLRGGRDPAAPPDATPPLLDEDPGPPGR